MGVGPSDYAFYGRGHRYAYVAPDAYSGAAAQPLDGDLFQGYSMNWDSYFLGGVFTILFILWNLVWSEVLNFLLLTYVVQWSLQINVIMMFIELGLIVIGLIFSCVYAFYADNDVYALRQLAISGQKSVSTIAALRARRSRANVNMDLTMCLVLLSFNWLEVTWVSCYTWGTIGNAWATKTALDETATSPIATVNYPLTSSHWGGTFNARLVEKTLYRSLIHLFIVVKGIVFMVAFFLSRFAAMDIAVAKKHYDAAYDLGGGVQAASPEFIYHVGSNVRTAAPLMSTTSVGSSTSIPMTTYVHA
jgi:hypothetical protein